MSIPVALEELAGVLADYRDAYLLTVSDDGRPHAVAAVPELEAGRLVFLGGRRTRSNAAARAAISVVFPPVSDEGWSLIVDGDAVVSGDQVTVTPTWAVLHRPASTAEPCP